MMPLDDINKLGDAQKVKETDTLNGKLLKLQKMFEEVSLFYVKKVAEQINVIKEMNPTSINRMNIMTAVNEDISLIKRVLKNTIKQSIGPLKDVLQTALQEDWETENFKRLLDKHPLGEPQKKQLNRMTEMIARQTYGAMENLSNTTAIDRQYRKLVDQAVLGVTSGMGSYTEAVRDGIRELGHAGMQIEYASGYHRRLDSAIMQNITNAAKQISQQGADLCREQMGTDAVELSAHVSPAPDHEPVQGRVFLNAEFAKMQTQQDFVDITGKHYKGFRRPIGEWNCMHIANPFDTQDSIRTWTDKDLQDMINANAKGFIWNGKHYTMYQGRQLMRRIETQIRREKDTAIAARTVGDSVLEKQCKDRISALEKRYADLCRTAELPPQWERTVVEEYRVRRTEKSSNINSADDSIKETGDGLDVPSFMKSRDRETPLKSFSDLKVKNRNWTIEEDLKAVNPNYEPGTEYGYNCSRCVCTYELRRRGYDAQAKGTNPLDEQDYFPQMTHERGWLRSFVSSKFQICSNKNPKSDIENRMLSYGNGSRGIVRIAYSDKTGKPVAHTFFTENENGQIRFIDPQTAKDASNYFNLKLIDGNTCLIRVDDKKLSEIILESCINRPEE